MRIGRIPLNSVTLKYAAYGFAALVALGFIAIFFFNRAMYGDMPRLPDNEDLWAVKRDQAYEFRDNDDDLITVRGPHYGQVIPSSELAPHVVQAFIAAEDKRFYDHDGADTTAIVRAAWSNWRSGRTVSGASTITQQTAKNVFLWNGGGVVRKAGEAWMAVFIDGFWGKERVLEMYLNIAEWGDGLYGAEAAAYGRFGKPASELTAFEAARLAAVLPSPNKWRANPAGPYVRQRTRTIQARMNVVQRDGLDACVLN